NSAVPALARGCAALKRKDVRRPREIPMNDEEEKVVDLGVERVKRKARDLYVVCPRCGESNFMRDTRCQHCGLWFQGEAFQFAPAEETPSRKRRLLNLAIWAAATILIVLVIAAVRAFLRS